jgi:hypothetical protein
MNKGTLSRTGNTQNGKRLTSGYGEVQAFQNFNPVTILDKGLT